MTEFIVTMTDPNVAPVSGDQPTPVMRRIEWRGDTRSALHARQLADLQWEQTYGAGTQPANIQVSVVLADSAAQAAARWLQSFIGMYQGIDTGEGDPVHAVRMKAQELLDAGPTPDDPVTIAEEIAAALPGDSRAASLGDMWRNELSRIGR